MLLPFKVYPVLLYTVYSECVVSQNYIMIFVWSQFFFHNDNVVFTYNIIVNGYHLWQYKKKGMLSERTADFLLEF